MPRDPDKPDDPAWRGAGRPDAEAPGVGDIAELYLGNILYALERCSMTLEGEGDSDGAAYYRGLARSLAEARGEAQRRP